MMIVVNFYVLFGLGSKYVRIWWSEFEEKCEESKVVWMKVCKMDLWEKFTEFFVNDVMIVMKFLIFLKHLKKVYKFTLIFKK